MARGFTGTDSISLGSSSTIQPTGAAHTVAAWINPNSTALAGTPVAQTIFAAEDISSGGSFDLRIVPSGVLQYFITNGGTAAAWTFSTGLTAGTWASIVATCDGSGNLQLYANGSAVGSAGSGTLVAGGTNPVGIGTSFNAGSPTRQWAGNSIAEVGVWTVKLTTLEIAALAKGIRYNAIRPKSLVGYWPLDGIQSPEPDLSGNKHNGTLTGTSLKFGPPLVPSTPRWPQFNEFTPAAVGYPDRITVQIQMQLVH